MGIRAFFSWTAFPALLIGTVLWSHFLVLAGYPPSLVVLGVTFAAATPILLLQLRMPSEERWRGSPKDFRIDLLHMVSTGLTGDLWRALTFTATFAASAWLAGALGMSLWPTQWPILAQLALALVIGDFGAYWVHRGCHTVPLFWRIHAMHHSSEKLYVFSATRNHPLNVVLGWGAQVFPLILMGASEHVLVLMSVFTAVHGMLQHANIDFKHGWLNYVFATADLHRWHHSSIMEESNTNYGSNLILWDIVFGTRMLPEDRAHPQEMGIDGVEMPENFLHHMASPFLLDRYTTEEVLLSELPDEPDFTLETAGGPREERAPVELRLL